MTATWIHLAVHKDHPKILEMAHALKADPKAVVCAAIDWFRWIDANCRKPETPVTAERFPGLCKWEGEGNIFDAFVAIGWIELSDAGTIVIIDYLAHFGKCFARRCENRAAMRRARDTGVKYADTEREQTFPQYEHPTSTDEPQKAHEKDTHNDSYIYKKNKQQQVLSNPRASESPEHDTTATAAALCSLLVQLGFDKKTTVSILRETPECTRERIEAAQARVEQIKASPTGARYPLALLRTGIREGWEPAEEPVHQAEPWVAKVQAEMDAGTFDTSQALEGIGRPPE